MDHVNCRIPTEVPDVRFEALMVVMIQVEVFCVVIHMATWLHNPENINLNLHCHECLKSHERIKNFTNIKQHQHQRHCKEHVRKISTEKIIKKFKVSLTEDAYTHHKTNGRVIFCNIHNRPSTPNTVKGNDDLTEK
jgi:hypothetical protein